MDAALRAEHIALAIINGEVSTLDAIEDLRLANREKEVTAQARALRNFRSGAPVWSFPARAPWAGF